MMNWFQAGGFGMFAILILGAGAIGFGAKVIGKPTAERVAMLRALPALIGFVSVFGFGTGLWAVNVHLTGDAGAGAGDAFVALMGVCEAAQALTLGALMAAVVTALRMVAEVRAAQQAGGEKDVAGATRG